MYHHAYLDIHLRSKRSALIPEDNCGPRPVALLPRGSGTVHRTVAKMSTGYSSGFRTIFGFSFFFAKNFPIIVATFQFLANGGGWDGYVRGI